MRINHNIAAMNTYGKLTANNAATAKSLEKLSSGLKINRAGDNAAGLAISEKMRAQVRGLDQANTNAQDGVSLIQTAEGALNETHSILQRMRELAVQSSTDTNTADDRSKIQSEVDELAKEITRISNTTEFNTKNLLAGGLSTTFHIGANQNQSMQMKIGAMDAQTLGVAASSIATSISAAHGVTSITEVTANLGTTPVVTVQNTTAAQYTPAQGGIKGALTDNGSAYTGSQDLAYQIRIDTVAANEATGVSFSTDGGTTWTAGTQTAAGQFTLSNNIKIDIAADATNAANQIGTMTVTAATAELVLANSVGDIGDAVTVRSNQSSVVLGNGATGQTATVGFTFASLTDGDAAITQVETASTAAVVDAQGNVSGQAVVQKGINVSTQSAANNAITTIDNAIKSVSTARAQLGAFQNRLEHTSNNLSTSSENLSAAESRVRDVDMAKEMMEFQKNNILNQASTAMLAQANQQPQGVLQLLQ